jgi:putative ABC transport system permease protein
MDELRRDLVHAARSWRHRPAFALAAVLTLALGIGANASVFGLVRAVLLRPLPFTEPERLVTLSSSGPGRVRQPFSAPDFLDLQRQNRTLLGMAGYGAWGANLTGRGDAERLQGMWGTAGFLRLLGVPPALGRGPLPEEERAGGEKVVVLTHGLWQRRFGADPAVLGTPVHLSGEAYTVIGVLPPAFALPGREAELVVPLALEGDARREVRLSGFLRAVARLGPGVTPGQAQAELTAIAARLAAEHPETNAARTGVGVTSLHEDVVGNVRPMLLVAQGAVALVLLVACANLASLLLARAAARRREMAVRAALGAGRGRLVRQLLTESLLLSVAGGALGLVVALAAIQAFLAFGPVELPRARTVRLDAGALAFTAALSVLAGLVFGLAPALQGSRGDPQRGLAGGGRGEAGGPARARLRRALVLGQVAVSLVLLAGAGLLLKSLKRLQAVDPGYRTEGLLTLRVSLPRARYGTREALAAYHDRLAPRLRAIPGVAAAAAASVAPLTPWRATINLTVEGRPAPPPENVPLANYRAVDEQYFAAMQVPLLRGRPFADTDAAGAAPVAVVNRTLADRYWPDGDALGARLRIDDDQRGRVVEVVGVAGDVKHYGLDDPPSLDVYVPYVQAPQSVAVWLANSTSWVLRARVEPRSLAAAVKREVQAVDAEVAASAARSMEDALADTVAPRRFNVLLLEAFALAALLLAAGGIYGVTAFLAAQRTREIGVRIALGARPREILSLVLGQGLAPVAGGLAAGLALSMGLSRLVEGLLFGVAARDPATFALAPALLAAAAAAASAVPALRAARLDPVRALRLE